MRSLPHSILALFATTLPLSAQQPPAEAETTPQDEATDWRLPFRSPQANLVPPEDMYEHLRVMYQIASEAPPEERSYDDRGAEVIDDPDWQAAYEGLQGERFDGGYLSLVLRDSRNSTDRRIAFYGAFYCPDPQTTLQLIEHIPGEPLRELRQEALQRAVPYLEVWLPRRNPGELEEWQQMEVGPAGERPPRPGAYSYGLDPTPFLALAARDEPIDQQQMLWFLARCTEQRPLWGAACLELGAGVIERLVAAESAEVRAAAADFLAATDPDDAREPADPEDPAALRAWFDAILYDLFPPLRQVSPGLYDLYPSEDREALVAAARKGLRDGTLLEPASGTDAEDQAYFGLRIEALPEPLDRLGLSIGDTLTAIDGLPVNGIKQLVGAIEARAKAGARLLVEYIDPAGEAHAIEYRIR